MVPRMKLLYEQMAAPKYVIAMGSCAIGGGPFAEGYNVVNGVDSIIPVDIYLPAVRRDLRRSSTRSLTLMERNEAGEPSAAEQVRRRRSRRELGARHSDGLARRLRRAVDGLRTTWPARSRRIAVRATTATDLSATCSAPARTSAASRTWRCSPP